MVVEDRRVDGDGEAFRRRGLYAGNSALKAAFHADRLVVMLLDAVEVHGEEQVRRGLELVQLLFEQQRIGAERNELLARHDAFEDGPYVLVDQGLAARNGHHWLASFFFR